MKLHISCEPGPSPGMALVGTKEDLRELATQLGAAVDNLAKEGKEEGSLHLADLRAEGDAIEWIEFRAVREVDTLFERTKIIAKRRIRLMPFFWLIGIALLYLIYLGLRTLIT